MGRNQMKKVEPAIKKLPVKEQNPLKTPGHGVIMEHRIVKLVIPGMIH